jgi:tRNA modification GTPase
MKLYDTIAAVSTPRGKGGVALIRISGSDAVAVAQRVFVPASKKPFSEIPAGKMVYGDIRMPEDPDAARLDDGMAVFFRAPHSYTGEDTVEITCHGGILITEAVLSAVLIAGARPAEAGEFTRRAFVNGKLALSEAEALGSLLEAKTEAQMRLSRSGMDGRLSSRIDALSGKLRHVLASVYARIDYPDEDLADLSDEEMHALLAQIRADAARLSETYRTGRAAMEGIDTVICGPANAGKSSLYNALVGREAAIVTDIAGTTRDMLSETVALGNVTLRLTDTAGLRETSDRVEQIGIDRARRAMDRAELILAVVDASREPDAESEALLADLRDRSAECVILLNKSDAGKTASWDGLTAGFSHVLAISLLSNPEESVLLLRETAEAMFTDGSIDLSRDAVVANARQYASLVSAIAALDRAMEAIACGMAADLYCMDAEGALAAFGELDGKEVGEAIVSEIFSKFCVGK